MLRTLFFVASCSIASVPNSASATCESGEIVIKFSHVTNNDKHPKGIAASLLAARVNQEMNGKACMEVFPNATLYDDEKVLGALLNGDIQIAAPHTSYLTEFSERIRIYGFPFAFRSFAAVKAFQATDEAKAISSTLEESGLTALAMWHGGMTQISANKPILRPDDSVGLKLRGGYLDVQRVFLESLGASPTRIPFNETGAALENGAINGLEATYTTLVDPRLPGALANVTETNHGVVAYVVVTSVDWLASLPDDVREQLLDILHVVTGEHNVETVRQNKAARQVLEAAGTSVHVPSDEEREQWNQASALIWSDFADSEMMRMINVLRGINETCHDGCCKDCCEDDPDDCD